MIRKPVQMGEGAALLNRRVNGRVRSGGSPSDGRLNGRKPPATDGFCSENHDGKPPREVLRASRRSIWEMSAELD